MLTTNDILIFLQSAGIRQDPDNAASKRVLEKCGFALNGVIGEEGSRWAFQKGKSDK